MDDRLRKVFSEVFAVRAEDFSDRLSPDDVQNWDSLGHLRLVMALQDEFGVEFDVEEVMQMQDIARIRERLLHHGVTA